MFTNNHVTGLGNVENTQLLNHQVVFIEHRLAQPSQGHPHYTTFICIYMELSIMVVRTLNIKF